MSLKEELLQVKKEKKEKEITERIEAMLEQQIALLDTASDINKDGDIVKVKKEWNDDILTNGGVSYYKMNGKFYRVSVCDCDNDVVLKFRFKDAIGRWVSVSARSLKEAQNVIDDIYGTSKDGKHKYTLSACRV